MKRVNIAEAKARLSELIDAAERGENVVLSRRGVAVARIVPIREGKVRPRFGVLAGAIRIGPDFEAPLDDFADYR